MTTRELRLDAAKGIAILLVIYGHVARGLFSADLLDPGSPMGLASERFAYFLHLPLFAFATGLFIGRSVERRGSLPYLRVREAQFVWVYLVWTLIIGAFSVITSGMKNEPISWLQVFTVWKPLGHLWYLPFLMVATLLVALLRPWRLTPQGRLGLLFCFIIGLSCWGISGQFILIDGLALLIFFAAGCTIRTDRLVSWWESTGRGKLALLAIVFLGSGLTLGLLTDAQGPTIESPTGHTTVTTILLGLVTCVCNVIGTIALCGTLRGKLTLGLAYLGKQSLLIYLAHTLATAATRIVLVRFGIDDSILHVSLAMLAGVVGPLMIVPFLKYVPWLLQPPRAIKSRVA